MALFELDGVGPALPPDGTSFVAENASVIGRVRLGVGSSIWFGAVVRGDTEDIRIGDRSNVQDNGVLHADPGFPLDLGPDCTVGHGAIVHGCTIGAGSLIGMGAIVLNGAWIGPRSLVGAQALVTEGKVFPEGVLIVGAPARVARPLSLEEMERLVETARRYASNAERYLRTLRRIS